LIFHGTNGRILCHISHSFVTYVIIIIGTCALCAAKGLDPESPGIILYDVNTTKQTILFTMSAVDGAAPKLGDKVAFQSLLDYSCVILPRPL